MGVARRAMNVNGVKLITLRRCILAHSFTFVHSFTRNYGSYVCHYSCTCIHLGNAYLALEASFSGFSKLAKNQRQAIQ